VNDIPNSTPAQCGTATGGTVRNRPGGVQTADAFRAEHTPTSISGGRRLSAESQSVQEGKPDGPLCAARFFIPQIRFFIARSDNTAQNGGCGTNFEHGI